MGHHPENSLFLRQSRHARRVIKALLLTTAVIIGCLAPWRPAEAVLFGSQSQLGQNLYIIDPATGAGTPVGDMGVGVVGIAVHPVTGVLYGSTSDPVSPTIPPIPLGSLVTINTTTGAATLVGSFGLPRFTTLGDLAFNPLTGVLYGWSTESGGDLYTVNLTTGAATKVGESSVSVSGDALASNGAGTLYLAGEGTKGALRTVDKTTGLTTAGPTLSGFDICGCPHGESIFALAFNGSTLYGVTSLSDELITINVATGVITDIGPAVGPDVGIEGIAFTTQVPDHVPEPAGLILTLSGVAALFLRRSLTQRRAGRAGTHARPDPR